MVTPFGRVQAGMLAREQHRENAGRFGTQFFTYQTEGTGELVPELPLMFDNPFVDEPFVAAGHVLIRPPNRELFYLPTITMGVLRWVQDEKKWYSGAYIYFRVRCEWIGAGTMTEAPTPLLQHHLQFIGTSYKAMPATVNLYVDEDPYVTPRTPPIMG